MKKKKRQKKKNQYISVTIEDLFEITKTESEEDLYSLVFSGTSSSVRPVWLVAAPISMEEYWVINCPYIRFCSRSMSLTLPNGETKPKT